MGFRSIEISNPAEIHIQNGQMQCIDQHYKPQAIVLSNESNVRQTLITHQQILMSQERIDMAWKQIVVA